MGGRSQYRPPSQDSAGIHPHRGRGLLPAPPGRGQRGTVCGRCPGAPARAGPTRGHLCSRLRVRLPARLCAADAAGLRFVVPLRADTGWAHWFTADLPAGLTALPTLAHCPQRHRRLPTDQRTTWKGVLRDSDIDDPDTGTTHRLRIAYIWSSEEASSVAQARHRALASAEAALTRIRNGCGGRHYRTQKQVDDRVAKILGANIAELITVTTGTADNGTPTIAWRRNPRALTRRSRPRRALRPATNLPDPADRPLTALDVLEVYKDQWIVEQRHRDLKQTLHVRPSSAQRRPHPRAHRRHRYRPAHLRAHRSRPARRPRTPHPTTGPAARRTRRDPHRARPANRLHRPARHLHKRRRTVLDRLTPVQRLILAHLNIPSHGPKHTAHNTIHKPRP